MKGFHWYPIIRSVTLSLEIVQLRFKIVTEITNGIFSNSLLLFHFTFLSIFIYRVLRDKKKLFKKISILFSIFFSVILFCLFTNDLKSPILNAFAFTNFGLVIFCCFYYFQIFENVPTLNLLMEPAFWIINGIFFCMCGTIPVLALTLSLRKKSGSFIFSGRIN